jgi:5-methylcytosine-specific restriction enzyme subunit McrC
MVHPHPPHTFVLTERRTAVCRLGVRDVEYLLAEHRGHVRLTPTAHPHQYRLTPLGHVGVIVGPGCRLVIRPKIPLRNLFTLLDPTGPVPLVEDHTRPTQGGEELDYLAGRLARLLGERAAAGLHRAYTERAERGPFLQGRLDVAAQVRELREKAHLHCTYEEFTPDVPLNQLPKATAQLALRSPLLDERVRGALRRVLEAYTTVSDIAVGPESFVAAACDRLSEPYRPLLDLCRLLVASLGPGATSGTTPYPAFLLDMEQVFEAYVTEGVRAALVERGAFGLAVQPLYVVKAAPRGRPEVQLRPDFTVDRAGRPVLVGDAKWKRLAGGGPRSRDVHQVLAYCTVTGARHGVLVYPGGQRQSWRYSLGNGVWLTVHSLPVHGSRAQCVRALQGLGRSIRRTAASRRD